MDLTFLTDKKIWLAPLAGYTDSPFRKIAKLCKADVLVSEMVSADGLIYNSKNTESYCVFDENERPFGIQLFGSDSSIMGKATEIIMKFNPDFVDINMGCPVKKVVNRGAGSALMKDISNAAKITEAVKNVCEKYNKPLSVKFRSGWDLEKINYLEFGKALQNAGADILILHPRTRSQMFTGHSDWNHIKELKTTVNIPVIGNGDIVSPEDAEALYELSKCDGIMIGRGALGKPWIFADIKNININLSHKEIIKQHFLLKLKHSSNNSLKGIYEMRSHLNFYSKGQRNSSQFRQEIQSLTDPQKIINLIDKL